MMLKSFYFASFLIFYANYSNIYSNYQKFKLLCVASLRSAPSSLLATLVALQSLRYAQLLHHSSLRSSLFSRFATLRSKGYALKYGLRP